MLPHSRTPGKKRSHCVADAFGIDAVVPVEVRARSRLAEEIYPERNLRHAEGGADEREGMGMPVEDGHNGYALLLSGDERLEVRARPAESPVEAVGARHDEHIGEHARGPERAAGLHG